MATDAEFYQCVSNGNVLTYKHVCTTNILIKVEKFLKYYTAVAEKIRFNSFAPRSLTFDD